eukprot:1153277-Pelagomonas_calceolata.AAC.13
MLLVPCCVCSPARLTCESSLLQILVDMLYNVAGRVLDVLNTPPSDQAHDSALLAESKVCLACCWPSRTYSEVSECNSDLKEWFIEAQHSEQSNVSVADKATSPLETSCSEVLQNLRFSGTVIGEYKVMNSNVKGENVSCVGRTISVPMKTAPEGNGCMFWGVKV